jgi:hypothetical protein
MKDAHFTVLSFTAATREPLPCAIKFSAKMLKQEWITGFDHFAEWVGTDEAFKQNCGDGEPYLGPSCTFRGKEVSCFCCNSESGRING